MVWAASCRFGVLLQCRSWGRQRLARVRRGIFSGGRGSGRWLTGQPTARFPAGVRLPTAAAVTRGGFGWSNAQVPQASSPSLACGFWNSPDWPGAMFTAPADHEDPRGWQLQHPTNKPTVSG